MAVIIGETCITCDACLQQCPVNAIVDDAANPLGLGRYYVQPEKCIECVGVHEDPQCAAICPSIGCITWDLPFTREHTDHFLDTTVYALSGKNGVVRSPDVKAQKYREDIPLSRRGVGECVQTEPEEMAV